MIRRPNVIPLIFFIFTLFTASKADAAKRVALVIGNGAYSTAPLKNPPNDAGDMARALEEMGFEVIHLENAGQRAMEDAIHRFGKKKPLRFTEFDKIEQ